MFNNIKSINKRGNKINEDFIGITSNSIFVIDGASGLNNTNISDYESDAKWFSNTLGYRLNYVIDDISKDIKDILYETIEILYKEYVSFNVTSKNENDGPSAAISIFRIKDDVLEYFQLGDCTSLIKFYNGQLRILHDDSVTELDSKVVCKMVILSKEYKIPLKKTMDLVKEELILNRSKKNTEQGYWILDISGVGIEHAYYESFFIKDIRSVAMMSDGFADIHSTFEIYKNFDTLNTAMEQENIDLLVKRLFYMQETDLDMNKYPRLKFRDDTSAIWANVCK